LKGTASDADQLSVHRTSALVGARESVPSVVDLLLRELFDREQLSNCVTCFDELAVCGNDFSSLNHILQLTASLGRAEKSRS
jgi:hypothetical protein